MPGPWGARAADRPRQSILALPDASGLPELAYTFHGCDALVTACGRIRLYRKRVNISAVFAGQRLGIKEASKGIWLVRFMRHDPGFIDLEQKTLQPFGKPFSPKLSPMSPGWTIGVVAEGEDRKSNVL